MKFENNHGMKMTLKTIKLTGVELFHIIFDPKLFPVVKYLVNSIDGRNYNKLY